ncbi:MAG: response regulator [Bdellovibrionota bacterium]
MRRSVLVVEDDSGVRFTITESLGGFASCMEACSPEEALAQMKGILFDAVLLDVNFGMGRPKGWEVLEFIKRANLPTPIVLITSDVRPEIMQHALDERVFAFLPKPFTRDQIQITVTRAFEEFDLRRELQTKEQLIAQMIEAGKWVEENHSHLAALRGFFRALRDMNSAVADAGAKGGLQIIKKPDPIGGGDGSENGE